MEYKELLSQHEEFWHQKSLIKWLALGDANTKVFHFSTIIRRKQNKIFTPKNSEGEWIEEQTLLKNHVGNFFINLFELDSDMRALPSWKAQ